MAIGLINQPQSSGRAKGSDLRIASQSAVAATISQVQLRAAANRTLAPSTSDCKLDGLVMAAMTRHRRAPGSLFAPFGQHSDLSIQEDAADVALHYRIVTHHRHIGLPDLGNSKLLSEALSISGAGAEYCDRLRRLLGPHVASRGAAYRDV